MRSCSLRGVNSLIIQWNHLTCRDNFCLVFSMRKCENSLLVNIHCAITIIVSVWDICEMSNQKFWKSKHLFIYLKFLNVFFVKIKCETALIVHTLGLLWYAVAEFLQFALNFFCFLPDQKNKKKLACLEEGMGEGDGDAAALCTAWSNRKCSMVEEFWSGKPWLNFFSYKAG